uniref:Dipeptidylpeptidase IV N-terminal domain-containing protein n=1 Tax=viral metagenome TaxID=1070528 RepID=A0A6C0JEI9_9ZZZZ
MDTILSKTNLYPIVLPTKNFKDRFNNPNSYNEMNPSMYIDEEGNVKILIRCVNYRKFKDRQFVVYDNKSNSMYYQITGKIEENENLELENYELKELVMEDKMQKYPTYWTGMEDIRFIDQNNILVTVPQFNQDGNASIFEATITDNFVHSFIDCEPNLTEKNWMPFMEHNGETKVIYSVSPFLIKTVREDTFTEINVSSEDELLLRGYHGSTNGLKYRDNVLLFLIHINNDQKTLHRWLLYDTVTTDIRLSEPFIFFRHSHIEFPLSLCRFEKRIFISLGVNDEKAFIIETNLNNINKLFV